MAPRYVRSRPRRRRATIKRMVWDQPPQPVVPTTMRQVPILYNADTGQRIGGRLQRWANGFTLPGQPAVKVRLTANPDPSHEPAAVGYDETLGENIMYFNPGHFTRKGLNRREMREMQSFGRETVYDELTHLYDRSGRLPETAKQQFQQIMGDTRPWRAEGGNSPHEQFSEASLAYMRGYKKPSWRWTGGYGFEPNQRQWKQIRRLFDELDG